MKNDSTVVCKINFSSNKISFLYDNNEFTIYELDNIFVESKFIRFGVFSSSCENQIEILSVKNNLTLLDIDNPIKNMQHSTSRLFKDSNPINKDNYETLTRVLVTLNNAKLLRSTEGYGIDDPYI